MCPCWAGGWPTSGKSPCPVNSSPQSCPDIRGGLKVLPNEVEEQNSPRGKDGEFKWSPKESGKEGFRYKRNLLWGVLLQCAAFLPGSVTP